MTRDELLRGLPRTIGADIDMSVIEAIKESITEDNGQTLYSSLLVKCPFCGCENPYVQTFSPTDYGTDARVVCPVCHVSTSREYQAWGVTYVPTGEDITRLIAIGRAIASWNRRCD